MSKKEMLQLTFKDQPELDMKEEEKMGAVCTVRRVQIVGIFRE